MYADDTQIYGACSPAEVLQLQQRVAACIDDVAAWMRENRLQFNAAKTEVIWCATSRRQYQIPHNPIRVGLDDIHPVSSVRNLGIFLDSDISMKKHVAKTVSSCFAVLRQIRSIRRSVTRPVVMSLITALVMIKLDYGNATLAGLPSRYLNQLQCVLHAAARLVFSARKTDHVTPLLRELHWLRVPERISYKLATLVFRCLHGMAPPYLANELHRVTDIEGRQRLRSASTVSLVVPSARLSTVGDRAFPVAAARVWNNLPPHVRLSPSLPAFKRRLKTTLFLQSFV
jgi:hypothetical protein